MATANGWAGVWRADETAWDMTPRRASSALVCFNLLDGLFTLVFLQLGVAEEANPLMRMAYEHSPLSFMLLKLIVVYGGVLLLWASGEARPARAALAAGAVLYAAIVAYHMVFLARLIGT